jgi:hypothetical protein
MSRLPSTPKWNLPRRSRHLPRPPRQLPPARFPPQWQELKAAKKGLTKANCKLGKVKKLGGATAKTGKIKSQSPKAGKVLAPGSKVSVKLGI